MSYECCCGRTFAYTNAFSNHRRTCKKSKTRLSSALESAKENLARLKRARLRAPSPPPAPPFPPSLDISPNPTSSNEFQLFTHAPHFPSTPEVNPSSSINLLRSPISLPLDDIDQPIATRKPVRTHVQPKRYQYIPAEPTPVLHQFPTPTTPPTYSPCEPPVISDTISDTPVHAKSTSNKIFQTSRNIFGLSRKFFGKKAPDHDPEDFIALDDLVEIGDELDNIGPSALDVAGLGASFYPYPNKSSFLLGDWYWCDGVQKSQESFRNLIKIVGDPEFDPAGVRNTNWVQVNKTLGGNEFDGHEWEDEEMGWIKTPVDISVPMQRTSLKNSAPHIAPETYTVGHFYHRPFMSVIREKLKSAQDDQLFHYEPFELLWQPCTTGPTTRIHGELYTSQEFLKVHRQLQDSPPEPGCNLPRVVVALMFWSDVTHLTSFGNAKLWPLYMAFGNESKYRRCRPSLSLFNHVAYFKKLPDSFQDFATSCSEGKESHNDAFYTHCQRELLHAQWKILLDDEFMDAYKHGMVITCCDGIIRRFYPRIFTYSADYPEKIALATVRNQGFCPCPRCTIHTNKVHNLGMKTDRKHRISKARVDSEARREDVKKARHIIYDLNRPVNAALVENLLKDESYTPTQNAFSDRLHLFPDFNLFDLFVVDFLHEIELGVWKSLFIHLMRILQEVKPSPIQELDRRFRNMPTFGKATIRRFTANSSEMKKMAAHNYEDLLQCAIPAFEGLLPEPHNRIVLDLLFIMAQWHGMAKLRLHTDDTLIVLDTLTTTLGEQLRKFKKRTCSAFQTQELPPERRAREKKKIVKQDSMKMPPPVSGTLVSVPLPVPGTPAPAPSTSPGMSAPVPPLAPETSRPAPASKKIKRLFKEFKLNTYKNHSLGDYVETIRKYGTTDSYNTESGELEHRTPKSRYRRTSKKFFIKQITQIERRQQRLRRIRAQHNHQPTTMSQEKLEAVTLDAHHHIGKSQNEPEHIGTFLSKNAGDPAIKDFLPRLKDHLLPRIKELMKTEALTKHTMDVDSYTHLSEDSTQDHNGQLFFKQDRIYKHRMFRINYTTYDIRRGQDIVNPNTSHLDIMVLNDSDCEEDEPRFLYARVLGIYHTNMVYTGPGSMDHQPRRMEFLWVRWFEPNTSMEWDSRRLDSVRFFPVGHEYAFGFLDPSVVLRSCHILPREALGKPSISLSRLAKDKNDSQYYYVNRFVDRDMLMRYYWGMGVGHAYSHGEQKKNDSVEEDMDFEEEEELEADNKSLEEDHDIYDGGEADPWCHDSDQEGSGENDNPETLSEDEEFLELEDMYN